MIYRLNMSNSSVSQLNTGPNLPILVLILRRFALAS